MRFSSSRRVRSGLLVFTLSASVASCNGSPAPAKTAAVPAPVVAPPESAASAKAVEPPDGPVPTLRTGESKPTDHPDVLPAQIERRAVDENFETLLVTVKFEGAPGPGESTERLRIATGGGPGPVSFAAPAPPPNDPSRLQIWIRRPKSAAGTAIDGEIFASPRSLRDGRAGDHFRFHADMGKPLAHDPRLLHDFERALAAHLLPDGGWSYGLWQSFAATRLREIAPLEKRTKKGAGGSNRAPLSDVERWAGSSPSGRSSGGDLSRLMATTTGALAVQAALQEDRPLFLAAARKPQTIPVAKLKLPAVANHPWAAMIERLGKTPPPEPLSLAAPAEFYYARAASLPVLFQLLDQVDAWGTPASHAIGSDPEDRQVGSRYETQLGLRRSAVTRAFGPKVVSEVAVVGSDPYLKEGSDVTLIFRVKDRALFNVGLGLAMAAHKEAHSPVATETRTIAGASVDVTRSDDGAIRQYRATSGDLELVSNSAGGLARVLETLAGKHARLNDQLDFRYMLARDANTRADVLVYMSDKFVSEVVGPRQKIGESRRQIALSELMVPGFAALLYGTLNGKAPESVADLTRSHLLSAGELSHTNGASIQWKPGSAARSDWGTAAALTPLIDLPEPEKVTEAERDGYERFARSYEYEWARYMDPIAIRLAFDTVDGRTKMNVDLRELPLVNEGEYREIARYAGAARFETADVTDGARVVVAIGEHSPVRGLANELRAFSKEHNLTLDWVGEWAMAGILDRSEVARAALLFERDKLLQAPPPPETEDAVRPNEFEELTKLPLYGAIDVKNPVIASLTLVGLRAMVEQAAPGVFDWRESSHYRDVSIVRISIDRAKAKHEFRQDVEAQLFYALTDGALILAMSEATLRHLIDDRVAGKGPFPATGAGKGEKGEQFTLDLATEKGRALSSVLAWLLEAAAIHEHRGLSRANAEALFAGAPEAANDPAAVRALAMAYFGGIPLPIDGGEFTRTQEGVKDPARGTDYAPVWPPLPVPGSPVALLVNALSHARGDVSFDSEGRIGTAPPMQSLHAHASFDLREPPAPAK